MLFLLRLYSLGFFLWDYKAEEEKAEAEMSISDFPIFLSFLFFLPSFSSNRHRKDTEFLPKLSNSY